MSEATKQRGPYAKTAAKKAAIASAARSVVLDYGHRGLTTAEVAERAGVSERAMLYHFPTKEHLLVAAAEAEEAGVDAYSWPRNPDAPIDQVLLAIPRFIAERAMARSQILGLYSYLSSAAQDHDHPAREFMRNHNNRAIRAFSGLVQRWQEAGLAHPDIEPSSVGRQLLGVWSGLQGQWLIDPSFDLATEVANAFSRLTERRSMEARQKLDNLVAQI